MKLLLALLLLGISFSKLFACAGSYNQMYIKDEYYNFIDPSMVNLTRQNPLYKLANSHLAHQERFDYYAQKKKEANIQAWVDYFQGELSSKEVHAIFYKQDSIKKHATFYENSSKYPNFAKYIHFLDLQNEIAQNNSHKEVQEILNKGLKLFEEEEQPFLKERYLYLLMRLYHHTGEYKHVEDIYVDNVLIVNPKGVVTEWIDALRAGAFQHQKQYLKANQLYGKIFQYHQTNAYYGYYDFKVKNDKEWDALLATAENNQTKALYYFLRALKWESEPLYELEAIANLAPQSIWFERLAYMILQELQYKRYDIMVHSGKKDKLFRSKVKNYKLKKEYYLKIIDSLQSHTFFTLYSKLYLNVLEYNSLKRKELVQLSALANNQQKPYADLLNYIYGLHQLSTNSASEQFILYTQLKPLLPKFSEKKQASILRYTALQLSTLNEQNTIEQTLNKLFAQNKDYRSTIFKALNHADAQKFQAYIEHEKRAFFEEKIFKKTMNALHKGDIAKILATLYLQEENFQEAQLYLRQVPQENVFSHYNPFNTTISGDNRSQGQTNYSQREFVQTMLRIESVLSKNPSSARDHFLYANGLYNKSWFGNFPMSSVLYRSPSLIKGEAPPKTMNLAKAKREYELALQYATKEEFRAKIAYQLLKIKFHTTLSNTYYYEQNLSKMPSFSDENNGTSQVIDILQNSKDFSEAIKDFRAEYEHTNFAQEVIEKCITFRYF